MPSKELNETLEPQRVIQNDESERTNTEARTRVAETETDRESVCEVHRTMSRCSCCVGFSFVVRFRIKRSRSLTESFCDVARSSRFAGRQPPTGASQTYESTRHRQTARQKGTICRLEEPSRKCSRDTRQTFEETKTRWHFPFDARVRNGDTTMNKAAVTGFTDSRMEN